MPRTRPAPVPSENTMKKLHNMSPPSSNECNQKSELASVRFKSNCLVASALIFAAATSAHGVCKGDTTLLGKVPLVVVARFEVWNYLPDLALTETHLDSIVESSLRGSALLVPANQVANVRHLLALDCKRSNYYIEIRTAQGTWKTYNKLSAGSPKIRALSSKAAARWKRKLNSFLGSHSTPKSTGRYSK